MGCSFANPNSQFHSFLNIVETCRFRLLGPNESNSAVQSGGTASATQHSNHEDKANLDIGPLHSEKPVFAVNRFLRP